MTEIISEKKFPIVSGENLEHEEMTLPRDLKGETNIAIVAFQQWHQSLVNEWIGFLNPTLPNNKDIEIYELPTLNRAWYLMRWMIDGGMRAGIHNKDTREHTITLYIKKSDFKEALEIPNEKTIYVFVLDSEGTIHHKSDGRFTQEKGDALIESIIQLYR